MVESQPLTVFRWFGTLAQPLSAPTGGNVYVVQLLVPSLIIEFLPLNHTKPQRAGNSSTIPIIMSLLEFLSYPTKVTPHQHDFEEYLYSAILLKIAI